MDQIALDLDGAKARDAGMASTLAKVDAERLRSVIVAVADRFPDAFTAEDVLRACPVALQETLECHFNALGGAIRGAALAGIIVSTGRVTKATHPAARKRNLMVWRRA